LNPKYTGKRIGQYFSKLFCFVSFASQRWSPPRQIVKHWTFGKLLIFSTATQLFMYGDGQVRIRVEQRSPLSTTVVHNLTQ